MSCARKLTVLLLVCVWPQVSINASGHKFGLVSGATSRAQQCTCLHERVHRPLTGSWHLHANLHGLHASPAASRCMHPAAHSCCAHGPFKSVLFVGWPYTSCDGWACATTMTECVAWLQVYPGIGWVMWRSKDHLPSEWVESVCLVPPLRSAQTGE